jgi:predicted nucleic acid-binding protein
LLPFDREAAKLAARMGAVLKQGGLQVPDLDLFIAASAIVWGDGEIVTRDAGHFRRLRPFGLRVHAA